MKRFATFLMTTLIVAAASAQDVVNEELDVEEPLRRYTVEVVIFSYVEDVSVGSEIFLPDDPPPVEDVLLDEDGNPIIPEDEQIPVFADDIITVEASEEKEEAEEEPLTWVITQVAGDDDVMANIDIPAVEGELDDDVEPNPFQLVLLTEDEFVLGNAIRKFELLDAYETIMHFGWTQPAFPEEETPAIELRLLAEPPEGLDGTFTLYRSRYLHLVVDLAFDAPGEFDEEVMDDDAFFSFGDAQRQYGDESEQLPVRFRIQENRIFKNGDLRYFDHPKFGVLAKVSRLEEPEEEEPGSGPEALALGSQ
jgi:hypothetical protein